MKQTFLIILCLYVFVNTHSQGITLLFKGGGSGWNDPVNWIQINTPGDQTPIQRVPTELDDLVFSQSQSGISSLGFTFDITSDHLDVGGNSTSGYRCRSMHISNTDITFEQNFTPDFGGTIHVYTSAGGFVLIDSGTNVRHGIFYLHGGNAEIIDLEINNSTFGTLFTHAVWSAIILKPAGRTRLLNSTLGLDSFGSETTGGDIYADNCTFNTQSFALGDNSTASLSDCTIQNCCNFVNMNFRIGRNANFVSKNVNITAFSQMDFYTSGSVLNGNVSCLYPSGYFNFGQEDPLEPLPNIINGNLSFPETYISIKGDVKISGNFINQTYIAYYYPDTPHIFINNQDIFMLGGGLCNCPFTMEFFGDSNSNIVWPFGLRVDTLIVNKSACAKVTFTNSLYVSGEARIQSGQLVLDPNDPIPYKFVCAGDLNISQGGGVFLRKDFNGVVANLAVDGAINDLNTIVDSTCTGFSNPYNGNVTLYKAVQNGGNNVITIASASNIGNLNLIGQTGSDFMLAGNLAVNNLSFINAGKLLLGDYDLVVNGNISNYGPANYFVTDGLGKLQLNNIGNVETVFPVGPSPSSYNPATLTNFGTPDNFRIHVQPQVLSGGTTGNTYIAGLVNRTWDIEESTPGASDVTVTLQWNAEDELSGFARNTSYVSHYTSGAWNNGTQMAATGSNPYSLTGTNTTNFSPFAVMGPASVVPVTLLDFYGKYKDKTIALSWSTETELNTNYFTVEKSVDPVLFKPLTDIPAYHNSQFKKDYHYVDHTFLNGINYYRLKMVDLDGRYRYSKTIEVSAPASHLVIFPNPVKDELFIRLPGGPVETTIRIADIKGTNVRTLQLKAGVTATSINISDLPVGVYSIILDSGKLKETQQFIKR